MSGPMGIEQARELMQRVQAQGARNAMPPLPVLRSAVMALAANCDMVLQLLDGAADGDGEDEVAEDSGPRVFGR